MRCQLSLVAQLSLALFLGISSVAAQGPTLTPTTTKVNEGVVTATKVVPRECPTFSCIVPHSCATGQTIGNPIITWRPEVFTSEGTVYSQTGAPCRGCPTCLAAQATGACQA